MAAARRGNLPPPGQLGLSLDLPVEHYEILHHRQRGVVIHWERRAVTGTGSGRWIKLRPNDPEIPEIFRQDVGKDDVFLSVNEFDGWRYIRLLRSLRALYVDIDDHTDLDEVLDSLAEQRLPAPSMAVWSGTGMHLYWLLEPLPPKTLPVWQRCQDALIQALKPLGADAAAKDCTRMLRLVGTRNRGEEVHARVLNGHRWALRQIAFEILGTEGRPKAQIRDIRTRRRRPDRQIQGSIHARWLIVYQDLLRISNHYHHQIPEGYRDKWLFLCAVALSWFTHAAGIEDEILGLGRMHTDLDLPEIRQAMQTPLKKALQAAQGEKIEWQGQEVDPRYRFRRQTLYDWIGDLIPASLLPSMRAIISDEEAVRRRKKRDQARYATHYTRQGVRSDNEQKRATARLLRAQGHTYRAIAAELGVPYASVHRWCALKDDPK